MNINVKAPDNTKRNDFQESVIDRLTRTLSRFSHQISRVNVTLTDENGPRGGVDKRCRVSVVMPSVGEFAASAKHENSWAAVAQATGRVRRKILTQLKRPHSLRKRLRRNRWEESDTPTP